MRLLRALLVFFASFCHGRPGSTAPYLPGKRKRLQSNPLANYGKANECSHRFVDAMDGSDASSYFMQLSSLLLALHPGAKTRCRVHPKTVAMSTISSLGGPVLKPSSPSDPLNFDSACVANPVVLPPSVTGTGKWQCYYYGNAGAWADGSKGFLPTGWVGLAESDDGIQWTKVVGKEKGGSILAPTGESDDWDGIHLGVGDVIRVSDKELHMYYFGGSAEGGILAAFRGGPLFPGLQMRIGKARSVDGGRTWERMGMILDYDKDEGQFASWPRIMRPQPGENKPWKMIYHAFNGKRWAAFGATSMDQGETWTRDGEMLLGPGDGGTWDDAGVGTRAVTRTKSGDWIMVYEAVGGGKFGPFSGKHRLGVARLKEGGKWEKDNAITGVPGGPMLEPGVAPLQSWTSLVIGTPYLVPLEDGSLRLYYCSRTDLKTPMSIGLVISETGDLSPTAWRPVY